MDQMGVNGFVERSRGVAGATQSPTARLYARSKIGLFTQGNVLSFPSFSDMTVGYFLAYSEKKGADSTRIAGARRGVALATLKVKYDQLGFLDNISNGNFRGLPFPVSSDVYSRKPSGSLSSSTPPTQITTFEVFIDPQDGLSISTLVNKRQSLHSLVADASWAPWVPRIHEWATPGSSREIRTIVQGRFMVGPDAASASVLCCMEYSPYASEMESFSVLSSICAIHNIPVVPV